MSIAKPELMHLKELRNPCQAYTETVPTHTPLEQRAGLAHGPLCHVSPALAVKGSPTLDKILSRQWAQSSTQGWGHKADRAHVPYPMLDRTYGPTPCTRPGPRITPHHASGPPLRPEKPGTTVLNVRSSFPRSHL